MKLWAELLAAMATFGSCPTDVREEHVLRNAEVDAAAAAVAAVEAAAVLFGIRFIGPTTPLLGHISPTRWGIDVAAAAAAAAALLSSDIE